MDTVVEVDSALARYEVVHLRHRILMDVLFDGEHFALVVVGAEILLRLFGQRLLRTMQILARRLTRIYVTRVAVHIDNHLEALFFVRLFVRLNTEE